MPAVRSAPPEGEGHPLGPGDVGRLLGLDSATLERLGRHLELLRIWQRRINLVGGATLFDPWRRHVLDSAQLLRFVPKNARVLVDLGSGAGFPGLVLAICGVPEVHLIESDRRKAAFLMEAARVTGCGNVRVHAGRIEEIRPVAADVVTARALAPLDRLLELAEPFLAPHTVGIFPKGRQAEAELTGAFRRWKMNARIEPSLSAPEGRIVIVEEVFRAERP